MQAQIDLARRRRRWTKTNWDDAHEDLTRAGGDKLSLVQAQLDQHEASEAHATSSRSRLAPAGGAAPAPSPKATEAANRQRRWKAFSLRTKETRWSRRGNALERIAKHGGRARSARKDWTRKKCRKRFCGRRSSAEASTKPAAGASRQATIAPQTAPVAPANARRESSRRRDPPGPTGNSLEPVRPVSQLTFVKHLSADQKALALYDKRMVAEQQLATMYSNWLALVVARRHAFLHGVFLCILWIALVSLFVFVANAWVQRFFAKVSMDRREMHTMRAVTMFAVQALGIILILLVIFGTPSNFATVVALAGAGLTVALKDFIVGFFGWFVLMGKNGIRPGDWVEINGVGGEVLEVGLFRTMLLETGNWTDAGHPTGRKVTFVNSFAIEGHYFNFSTSGQWLWDEVQLQVPPEDDPYPIADAIQKIVTDDTAANSKEAEMEWQRVVPLYAKRTFSAVPTVTVRPEGAGVNILVRYLTRARERPEVRTRLYRALIELLRQKNLPDVTPVSAKPTPADPSNSGQKTPPERA